MDVRIIRVKQSPVRVRYTILHQSAGKRFSSRPRKDLGIDSTAGWIIGLRASRAALAGILKRAQRPMTLLIAVVMLTGMLAEEPFRVP